MVIFSQWLRMHEVLIRRFEARGWGHVLFHGGIPADKRQALVDRFRDDPHCRLFLATDAGLVATPAPGSIFAYAAVTPRGGWFGVFARLRR